MGVPMIRTYAFLSASIQKQSNSIMLESVKVLSPAPVYIILLIHAVTRHTKKN